ncbi:MAG: helix-turn-helix domain-containing protein [Methylocella sp.]
MGRHEGLQRVRTLHHPDCGAIELTRVLYALSDPVRLEIVRQLDREGAQTCNALDGGRPKSSMSHHFRVLRDSGVILTRTDGPSHMNELRRADLDRMFPGLLAAVLNGGGASRSLDGERSRPAAPSD